MKRSHQSLQQLAASLTVCADTDFCCFQDCWWAKPVIVYGPPSLAKDHPVIKFLAEQQRCASVSYYKQG